MQTLLVPGDKRVLLTGSRGKNCLAKQIASASLWAKAAALPPKGKKVGRVTGSFNTLFYVKTGEGGLVCGVELFVVASFLPPNLYIPWVLLVTIQPACASPHISKKRLKKEGKVICGLLSPATFFHRDSG
mgnify:CR=1 FL=1